MMSLAEITQGKKWKEFMAKLYGLGAAVVILGAMFKIMHFPGAGPMLVIGLSTEAIIFFFSAFEPVHEDLDWTLAYPELKHGHDEEGKKKGTITEQLDEMLKDSGVSPEIIGTLGSGLNSLSETVTKMTDLSSAAVATDEFGKNVQLASTSMKGLNEKADKGSQSFTEFVNSTASVSNNLSAMAQSTGELGKNIVQTSETVRGFNEKAEQGSQSFGELAGNSSLVNKNLSSMAKGTDEFGKNVDLASQSMKGLNENAGKGTQAFADLISNSSQVSGNLSSIAKETNEYSESLRTTNSSVKEINSSYTKAIEAINQVTETSSSTKEYGQQISKMNKNLELLNALYEIDLQDSNKKLVGIINELGNTSAATRDYAQNIQQLSEKINTLNAMYAEEAQHSKERTSSVKKYYEGLEPIFADLSASAEGTRKYKEEIQTLGENLASLNTIYGNMLSAMSYAPGSKH